MTLYLGLYHILEREREVLDLVSSIVTTSAENNTVSIQKPPSALTKAVMPELKHGIPLTNPLVPTNKQTIPSTVDWNSSLMHSTQSTFFFLHAHMQHSSLLTCPEHSTDALERQEGQLAKRARAGKRGYQKIAHFSTSKM